jgi:hypothetical protein
MSKLMIILKERGNCVDETVEEDDVGAVLIVAHTPHFPVPTPSAEQGFFWLIRWNIFQPLELNCPLYINK